MSFAEWKERSKVFNVFKDRAERLGIGYEEVAQAAYRAGERRGQKDANAAIKAQALEDAIATIDEALK